MIVVALIGTLTTIAIPNMQKFQARSRVAEAKTHLRSMSTAYITYYHANDAVSTNLVTIGWQPEGTPRYIYGIFVSASADTGQLVTQGRVNGSLMVTNAGLPLSFLNLLPSSPLFVWLNTAPNADRPGPLLMRVAAVGNVDSDDTLDTWIYDTINIGVMFGTDAGFNHTVDDTET